LNYKKIKIFITQIILFFILIQPPPLPLGTRAVQDPLSWGYDDPIQSGSTQTHIIRSFAMTQMWWLTLSHPLSPQGARVCTWGWHALAHPSTPKHHMVDPSANVQGLSRVSPGAEVMVKGQLAIATPTPHDVRATQIPGFRFLLLL